MHPKETLRKITLSKMWMLMVGWWNRMQIWMVNGSFHTVMKKLRILKHGFHPPLKSKDCMNCLLKGRCWNWSLYPFPGGPLLLNEPPHQKETKKSNQRKERGRRRSTSQYSSTVSRYLTFEVFKFVIQALKLTCIKILFQASNPNWVWLWWRAIHPKKCLH